jgi:hypothetical protein
MWGTRHLTTLWAFTACYRDSFTFTFTFYWKGRRNPVERWVCLQSRILFTSNDRVIMKIMANFDFERSEGRGGYIKKITMYLINRELRMYGTEDKYASFLWHQTPLRVNVSVCSFSRRFIA